MGRLVGALLIQVCGTLNMLKSPHTVRKESRGCIPQCDGQSQIHPHLIEGIITHFFLTCKQHHKQSGKWPPHQCCKLSMKDPQRGVDNEIFTICNLAEKTLVLELKTTSETYETRYSVFFLNSVFSS